MWLIQHFKHVYICSRVKTLLSVILVSTRHCQPVSVGKFYKLGYVSQFSNFVKYNCESYIFVENDVFFLGGGVVRRQFYVYVFFFFLLNLVLKNNIIIIKI